jgi:MOSC domain-containing protein YiiM
MEEEANNHPTEAKVLKIYISSGHDYWGRQGEGRFQSGITDLQEVECVAGMGLKGDRYYGYRPNFKGQITFFDAAVVDEVRSHFKLAKLPSSVFRRNVIVAGLDLASLMHKRFTLQGIEFEGAQECKPCQWMDRAIAEGGEDFLKGNFRGGLRARIISGGILRVG